jgi:hypothetical protein
MKQVSFVYCVFYFKFSPFSVLFPPHPFDDLPLVPTLRHLELGVKTQEERIEQILTSLDTLFSRFPNLNRLFLDLTYEKFAGHSVCFY